MTDTIQVDMREAKAQLSQLAERVWGGERVVITKAGKPYLDLLPHQEVMRTRQPGRLKGRIRMAADFDPTPEEVLDTFEGSL